MARSPTEPFPEVEAALPSPSESRKSVFNRPAASSSMSGRLRRASNAFEQSDIPEGFFAATGGIASSMMCGRTISRSTLGSKSDGPTRTNTIGPVAEESNASSTKEANTSVNSDTKPNEPAEAAAYPNGYHFPPKHTFGHSTKLGLLAFWHYATTPVGFLVTLYGLNVVAWGGMLFLLLCNACKFNPHYCYSHNLANPIQHPPCAIRPVTTLTLPAVNGLNGTPRS